MAYAYEASPSPSVTTSVIESPTEIPTVAPLRTGWALHWKRQANKNRKPLIRIYRCLGRGNPTLVPKRPRAIASQEVWSRYGNKCKALAIKFAKSREPSLKKIFHPKGVSYAKWRPLIKWYWPACYVEKALETIRRESGGILYRWNTCGSGAFGLFQLCPAPPTNRRSASWQVRLAYRKFLGARAAGGSGWEPWAVW